MSVKLISYTQPSLELQEVGICNMKQLVTYCARVSNPDNQLNIESSDKLIKYLIKNNHWSPFEMVNICIEIETTRDISRQILRHRSFSFQEFSQRYAAVEYGNFSYRDARLQDYKNRQNSFEIDGTNELSIDFKNTQTRVYNLAYNEYQRALAGNIAKEQARALLPEGMTLSKMYMNGSLRSWIHYFQVRTDESTQKEHRDVALKCQEIVKDLIGLSDFPFLK